MVLLERRRGKYICLLNPCSIADLENTCLSCVYNCDDKSCLHIFNFTWQQFEVRWHCIRGRGYCYWSDYYGWSELTVNTTSATVNMTRYDMAYVFKVRVLKPQGRGKSSEMYYAIPAFSGMPSQFSCTVVTSRSNTFLVCRWLPPTDFNPAGFYVSSKI